MASLLAIFGLLISLGAIVLYRIVTYIALSLHNSSRARELKCQDPPMFKSHLPFGLDIVNRAIAADNKKLFLVDLAQRVKEVGALTHLYSTMGSTTLFTIGQCMNSGTP